MCTWYFWVLGAVIIYKFLDWLLRIPRIRDLNSRYILVTGCGRGFGREAAIRLDKIGCHVFAGCRREESETELRKICSSRLKTVHMDVTSPHSVKKALDFVQAHLPDGKGLSAIVNNAAVVGSNYGPLPWLRRSDYDEILNVNLHGTVDVTMTFLPLIKKERGRIINISSIAAIIPFSHIISNYSISKMALEAFSNCLRRELLPFGVKVISIQPSAYRTDMANPDIAVSKFKAGFSRCSSEVKREYGYSYADTFSKEVIKKAVTDMLSDKISEVIDAYEHAAVGRFPRTRYVVGVMGNIYRCLRWFPEWFTDELFSRTFGVIPQCCRN